MKKILLSIGIISSLTLSAQVVNDSILLEPNVTNQAFYSLENGEVANLSSQTWDLAFTTNFYGLTIRNNTGAGTAVYLYPSGDTLDWMSVDTAGMSSWSAINNDAENWGTGAFNQGVNPSNMFDQGWGIYNLSTHHTTGDSIYVVKDVAGDFHKLWIQRVANGTFYFKYADLDNSNEVEAEIIKSNGAGKNFLYYSLSTEEVLDREPANDSWDLLFTKYGEQLGPYFYPVTGVLTNNNVFIREARDTKTNEAEYDDFSVAADSAINEIGYDWKALGSSGYVIEDSLSYFVLDQSDEVWQVIMTGFGANTTGKVYFSKEKIDLAAINENEQESTFAVYPNPANDYVNILLNTTKSIEISLVSLDGRTVYQENTNQTGLVNHVINTNDFPAGIYSVIVNDGMNLNSEKLIIK
jgi:hypothetical protein